MTGALLAIETGGTKLLAQLAGTGFDARGRWATTTPAQAECDIADFVARHLSANGRLTAIGIAGFGPLQLEGADAGRMLATAKPGWTGSNLRAALATRFACPVAIDTDVNAAARAEAALDSTLPSLAYLTIGTGIGAGLWTRHGSLRGALHPEAGHVRLVRDPDDRMPSQCPFHADCAEGLAAGPAVRARLAGAELADQPDVTDRVAGYLAQLLVTLVLTWSPHRIVLGGGVASTAGLVAAIRRRFEAALGPYGVGAAVRQQDFIQAARLPDAGLAGALAMARELVDHQENKR